MQIMRTVNFGSRKGSLSTVGYALYETNGDVKQARTTTGVFEVVSGKGIYGCLITFDDTWQGVIVWDTGEATPVYASDSFNYQEFTGSSGSSSSGGGYAVVADQIWSKKEKERIIKQLKKIISLLGNIASKQDEERELIGKESASVINQISSLSKDDQLNALGVSLLEMQANIGAKNRDVESIAESVNIINKALSLLIQSIQIERVDREVSEHETAVIG